LPSSDAPGNRDASIGGVMSDPAPPSTVAAAVSGSRAGTGVGEFEEILKRLIERISRILQAEKCVFLLYDAHRAELRAVLPAFGFTPFEVYQLRTRVQSNTLSSHVFRTGDSAIVSNAKSDSRAMAEGLARRFGVRTSVSVPLTVEKRDGTSQSTIVTTIGVLHVFDKAGGAAFNEDDVRLLRSMSLNASTLISGAQSYRAAVQEKQELISTIQGLSIGFVVVNMSGRILQVNTAARYLLDIPVSFPTVGMYYNSVIHHDVLCSIIAAALNGDAQLETSGEITLSVPPGDDDDADAEVEASERIYQVQCSPLRGAEVSGIVVVLNDITVIRGVERMKNAFVSMVSHELRTPLTSIKGFVATLLADTQGFYDKSAQQEFFEIIDAECDRLTRLIDDLLNLSRIEQGHAMQLVLSDVDIPQVAARVIAAQRPTAESDGSTLVMNFPDEFPAVEADSDKIEQILTNLVGNAVKYSPAGGEITVAGVVDVSTNVVMIRVTDHGIGIPREHIGRVFERFYRVDNRDSRDTPGTGIGLYLVKTLSEAHHGNVRVVSEPGRGTTFTVTLPMKQPRPEYSAST